METQPLQPQTQSHQPVDAESAQTLLLATCRALGKMEHLNVFPDDEHGRIIVRIELGPEGHYRPYIERFGAIRIGTSVYFTLPRETPSD